MPFNEGTVKLAGDIIKESYLPMAGYLFHEGIDQRNSVKLFFARSPHVSNIENVVVTTE
jgi:hypothetical protein